jgi:hypothetical protein
LLPDRPPCSLAAPRSPTFPWSSRPSSNL